LAGVTYPDALARLNRLLDNIINACQQVRMLTEIADDSHDQFTTNAVIDENALISANVKLELAGLNRKEGIALSPHIRLLALLNVLPPLHINSM
jgi:hypothetical protein